MQNGQAHNVRKAFEQQVYSCRKGAAFWIELRDNLEIEQDDFVLLLPTNNEQCNAAALEHIAEWLELHAQSSAFIIHLDSWKYPVHVLPNEEDTLGRLHACTINNNSMKDLYTLHLLLPTFHPWLKVATLEGGINNTVANLYKTQNSPYDLATLFGWYLYHLENPVSKNYQKKTLFRLNKSTEQQQMWGEAQTANVRTHFGTNIENAADIDSTELLQQQIQRKIAPLEKAVPYLEEAISQVDNDTFFFFVNQRGAGDLLYMLECIWAYVAENNIKKYVLITNEGHNHKRTIELSYFFWDTPPQTIPVPHEVGIAYRTLLPLLDEHAPEHIFCSHYEGDYPRERKVLLANHNGLHYINFLRSGCYRLSSSTRFPQRNELYSRDDIIQRYFSSGLQPGKTVVLNASIVASADLGLGLDTAFWTQIASSLTQAGFTVATNLSSADENPIPGTIGLFCSLQEVPYVLDVAGYLVAARSGLCDLATLSSATVVAIYPDALFGRTESYRSGFYSDFWTLKRLIQEPRLLELVHHTPHSPELIPVITDYLCSHKNEAKQPNSSSKDRESHTPALVKYQKDLSEFRSIQTALLGCAHIAEWLQCAYINSENHPIALAFASRGAYSRYFTQIGFGRFGMHFIASSADLKGKRFVGLWDSVSDEAIWQTGSETIEVARDMADGFELRAIDKADEDTGKLTFSGFRITFQDANTTPKVFETEKFGARSGINIVAYSMKHNTLLDCINVDTGNDPLLLVRRFR